MPSPEGAAVQVRAGSVARQASRRCLHRLPPAERADRARPQRVDLPQLTLQQAASAGLLLKTASWPQHLPPSSLLVGPSLLADAP